MLSQRRPCGYTNLKDGVPVDILNMFVRRIPCFVGGGGGGGTIAGVLMQQVLKC